MKESEDEAQIREVIAAWMAATSRGDAESLRDLMSEEVVYLQPGQPPVRGRDAFFAGFKTAIRHVRIEGVSDIQEIHVSGSLAYCWNKLSLTIAPISGGAAQRREGPVLSVFRKEADGKWRLFRDANLLARIALS